MSRSYALLLGGLFAVATLAVSDEALAAKKSTRNTKAAAAAAKAKRPGEQKASTKGLEEALKKSAAPVEETRTTPAKLDGAPGKEVSQDAAADRARDEAIDQIKKILPKQKNPEVRADLLFQLAELWWEKSRYVHMKEEMPAYQAAQDAWHQCRLEKGADACTEPRPNTRKSELYRQNAVDLYTQIAKDYPRYGRVDEVIFILAYNKYELCTGIQNEAQKKKACDEAVEQYRRLITQHPNSPFKADALVQLGNHYFDSNQLAPARKAFDECAQLKTPRTETYCIYKLGWCDVNSGDYEGAIDKFKTVIARGSGDDRIRLSTEALRDIIVPFSRVNALDSAIAYFQKTAGREGSRQYIKGLSDVYFNAGSYDMAIKMYRYMLKNHPYDPNAPEWQSKIVLSFDKLAKRDLVLTEMRTLVDSYKPGSTWQIKNKDNKGATETALSLTEEALYNLVTDYHQEAIKTKSVGTYRLARNIYKEYVDNFPGSERSYQMRYYYAEILYALEEFQPAYEQYLKVAEHPEQDSFKKVSASNMLLAAEKLVDIEAGRFKVTIDDNTKRIDENKAKGVIEQKQIVKFDKDAKEQPLTTLEQQLVVACDRYAELVPDAEDESRVRLRAAVIYFDRVQYVEAARRFGYIIKKWPSNETSATAASLILESLETKEEWLALNKLAREFAQNKQLLAGNDAKKQAFRKKLPVYIEGSQFKYSLLVNEKQDYDEAAKLFSAFVDEFPKSKFAPIALYNAFVIFQRAKQLDTAIGMGEKLLAEYPNVDKDDFLKFDNGERRTGADGKDLLLLPILVFDLAKAYENVADFATAAKYYEQFATQFPKDDRTPDAQFNAGLWYRGLGETEKAIAAFDKYIKLYGERSKADVERLKLVDPAVVDFSIATIYEDQKAWQKAYDHLARRYLGKYPGEEAWKKQNARYKQFQALLALDKKKDALTLAQDIVKINDAMSEADKTRPASRQAAAHARFLLLEGQFESYQGMQFDSPRTLQATLKRKTDLKASLELSYKKVIDDGNPDYAIAALVRLAMLPRLFAKSLLEAPMPPGLDFDQQEIYRSLLEERAFEYEAPAIDALELALAKSTELGIYNEWVLTAQSLLAEFKPDLFQEIKEMPLRGSEFFFTASTPAGPAAGAGGDAR